MKKSTICLTSCFALLLVLAGCGGGATSNIDDNFVGTWEATEVNGESLSSMNSLFSSFGMTVKLNEDHSAEISYSGESLFSGSSSDSVSGTWEADGEYSCKIIIGGEQLTVPVSNNVMTLSMDTNALIEHMEIKLERTDVPKPVDSVDNVVTQTTSYPGPVWMVSKKTIVTQYGSTESDPQVFEYVYDDNGVILTSTGSDMSNWETDLNGYYTKAFSDGEEITVDVVYENGMVVESISHLSNGDTVNTYDYYDTGIMKSYLQVTPSYSHYQEWDEDGYQTKSASDSTYDSTYTWEKDANGRAVSCVRHDNEGISDDMTFTFEYNSDGLISKASGISEDGDTETIEWEYVRIDNPCLHAWVDSQKKSL